MRTVEIPVGSTFISLRMGQAHELLCQPLTSAAFDTHLPKGEGSAAAVTVGVSETVCSTKSRSPIAFE